MRNPQAGIFALGTSSHAYLEFDAVDGRHARDVVAAIASLREPRTTMGGVNLVAGFRPELWSSIDPDGLPAGLEGFNADLTGADGFTMPATQHDAVLWLSGPAYDVIFDTARAAIGALAGLATVTEETSSWSYQHDRDLTGFIDGTENPTLVEAPGFVLVPDGSPGEGGTVLLLQKWEHDAAAWEALPVEQQELAMGRRKLDSVELEDKPADSHVAATDQDRFGHIFRRNMAYGTVTDHGTMFVGFAAEQRPLAEMLKSMVETPDALTRFTHPLTGAYYFVPSNESLLELSAAEERCEQRRDALGPGRDVRDGLGGLLSRGGAGPPGLGRRLLDRPHPVTAAEFRRFVRETRYVTFAERPARPGRLSRTPTPTCSSRARSSSARRPARSACDDHRNWWEYVPGAHWKHPGGKGTTINGRDHHPVVQIAFEDAEAYASWAGKELPTEAEWEYAARGGLEGAVFAWGDEHFPGGQAMANTWQGEFPWQNLKLDGFEGTSPVESFPPNGFGLYDVTGNVWEWTADFFTRAPGRRSRARAVLPATLA